MTANLRRRILNPYGDQFPDDNIVKEIHLQGDGKKRPSPKEDRHVLLCWANSTAGEGNDEALYTQVIHLTGGPVTYAFYTPQVKLQPRSARDKNTLYSLCRFTRVQRDRILVLAGAVKYERHSWVNGCRVWTRDLLDAMLSHGLLQEDVFDFVDADVPLKKRLPESSEPGAGM